MSKKITQFTTATALDDTDWLTGIDNSAALADKNIKITKANALAGLVKAVDLGNAATKDVGTGSGDVAAGNAPAAAITSHETTYTHTNIPTTAQKAALNGNSKLSGADPVAALSDIADSGGGDMLSDVYDPNDIKKDAFARANHTGTQTLSTISDAGTAAGAATTDFDPAGSAAIVNDALTTHKGSGDHDSRYPLQTRTVNTGGSLSGGGDLSADRTLSLYGDTESPGNSRYYGTDEVGARGYHDLPLSSGANTDRESGPTSGSYAWDLAVYPGGFVVDPTDIVHFDAPTDPPPLDVNELHSFRLTITFGAFAHTWDTVWVNPPVPNPGTGMYIIAGEYDGEKYVLATPVLAR